MLQTLPVLLVRSSRQLYCAAGAKRRALNNTVKEEEERRIRREECSRRTVYYFHNNGYPMRWVEEVATSYVLPSSVPEEGRLWMSRQGGESRPLNQHACRRWSVAPVCRRALLLMGGGGGPQQRLLLPAVCCLAG